MDARAPITLSISPLLITSSEPDFKWIEGKLAAAGWVPGRAREVKGCVAVSMVIASPVPPAGLSKRKTAALEAGETVYRDTGLPATEIAAILIGAMGLRRGQVVRLHVERVYTLDEFGHADVTVEVCEARPV
jgi:hypothetical protein